MRKTRLFWAPALAGLLLAGCDLIGAQLRIELDVIPPNSSQQSTHQTVGTIGVDLTTNSDFRDNQDKIKSVDEVGFVFRVRNNRTETATGRIYMTAAPLNFPTPETLASSATLVLDGLTVPGSSYIEVDYAQSLALQQNQALLHQQVKSGRIYLYGVAQGAPFDVTIDQLTVVLVMTVTS